MADKVQGSSRRGISGGNSSDESEEKPVPGRTKYSAIEKSDSFVDSDSEKEVEGNKSQEGGSAPRVKLSTRKIEQARMALLNFSTGTTTATSATTSTAVRPPADSSPRDPAQPRKGSFPLPRRHAMPDSGNQESNRATPGSPTRPRYVVGLPKASVSSTNSPPSSPRRPSAAGSVKPAQTPRSQRAGPGTPRAGTVDVVDRNIAAALAMAEKICTRKGSAARLRDFECVLSQLGAIAPAARGKVLISLAKSWGSLPEENKGACLAELRELAADMPLAFRRSFLQQLLEQHTSNRDSDSEESAGTDPALDAERFAAWHDKRAVRCAEIRKIMKGDLAEEALEQLGLQLKKTGVANFDRSVVQAVIAGLDDLDPDDQNKVIGLFPNAGISCMEVLGALLLSSQGEEIGKRAKSAGLSLSTLYLGVLTGDRAAMQRILLNIGRASLTVSLHVYLTDEIGKLRRAAAPALTVAAASRAMLLEVISLSNMSEARRCLLMHAASCFPENAVYAALRRGELDDGDDYWAYAHRILAKVIDIASCHELASGKPVGDDDDDPDLASYAARARNLMEDDTAKTIADRAECTWDAPRLRTLMLGKDNLEKVKQAVFNVLDSELPYEDKLALLKCEADSVGDSVEGHVRQKRYEEAVKQYKKKRQLGQIKTRWRTSSLLQGLQCSRRNTAGFRRCILPPP